MRRRGGTLLSVIAVVLGIAAPAYACGGLVAPNGTINLLRTATLAAYVDGVEHYVTSFEFAGGGAEFGSIIPLPGIPSDVKRGGRWTLQRLQEEVAPPVRRDADLRLQAVADVEMAKVLLEKRIEALDITILEGGAQEVGLWAKENGFALPPDSPEVLAFYAERSPIFMAARFDVKRAQELGQTVGDGTPIHLSIPTPNPWVPLRILGLGRQPSEIVEADVFLLTESSPNLLPAPGSSDEARGVVLDRSEPATESLLRDLGSDKGMSWLPTSGMHLSYVRIDARAADLTHDLAIDASGTGIPSRIAAGLTSPPLPFPADVEVPWALWVLALAFGAAVLGFLTRGAMLE